MYYAVFVITMLPPVAMLFLGIIWAINPPKNKPGVLGYRTELSIKNDTTWSFAHRHISKLWIRLGSIMSAITALLMILLRDSYRSLFLWIIGGQMALLCISAFLVDGTMKNTFDKEGNNKENEDP